MLTYDAQDRPFWKFDQQKHASCEYSVFTVLPKFILLFRKEKLQYLSTKSGIKVVNEYLFIHGRPMVFLF